MIFVEEDFRLMKVVYGGWVEIRLLFLFIVVLCCYFFRVRGEGGVEFNLGC